MQTETIKMMNKAVIWNAYQRNRTTCVIAMLAVVVPLVMIARRPDQWLHPYLWVEDGSQNLPDFAAHGWLSVLHPLNGYFVLPTKLIFALSAALSFRWLPEISYFLTLLFTIAVLAAIALSPTTLRMRAACAIATLLLPIDPEVYAVSEYALWWGTLLAILPLFWKTDTTENYAWRASFIVFGGLSSPLLVFLLPLYAFKARTLSNRRDLADFFCASAVSAVQLIAILLSKQTSGSVFEGFSPLVFVYKFLGFFVYATAQDQANHALLTVLGLALLTTLVIIGIAYRKELGTTYFYLLAGFLLAALASVSRAPVTSVHPELAGPRYFFLPDLFLAWSILQIASIPSRLPQVVAVILFVLAGSTTLKIGQRRNDFLNWRLNVARCAASDNKFEIPIHYAGKNSFLYKSKLDGETCRRLIRSSLFDNSETPTIDIEHASRSEHFLLNAVPDFFKATCQLNRFCFGSYTNGDEAVGQLKFVLSPSKEAHLLFIPFVLGPGDRSAMAIVARRSDIPSESGTSLSCNASFAAAAAHQFSVCLLDLSGAVDHAKWEIVVTDSGAQWGQWLAIGQPLLLERAADAVISD